MLVDHAKLGLIAALREAGYSMQHMFEQFMNEVSCDHLDDAEATADSIENFWKEISGLHDQLALMEYRYANPVAARELHWTLACVAHKAMRTTLELRKGNDKAIEWARKCLGNFAEYEKLLNGIEEREKTDKYAYMRDED